jgi:ATP-dependent exoDNAse (exonuclease V) beta subunit
MNHLAILNAHERDTRIQFEELSHKYTIDGVSENWIGCTSFLHKFFAHFDADAVIRTMMRSPKWSASKYFGMTAQQIKKQWDDKAKASSEAGTAMHKNIERFYNLEDVSEVPSSVEWTYFLDFQKKYVEAKQFVAYRTEWTVFDSDSKVSGSIDMVFKKPDGTLAIYDWKRAEEIKTENRFQTGIGPLEHLPDTNYWHYTIQLNVYRYILQKNYNVVVSELALVILHPINTTWKVMNLNIMDDEVLEMIQTRTS